MVTTMPTRSKKPIIAERLSVRSVMSRARSAPTIARGRLSTMMKGVRSAPRLPTMTRYTSTTPTAIARKTSWKPSLICSKKPPLSMEMPGGTSSRVAIIRSTSTPTARVSSATISPVILAERSPSKRKMLSGAFLMPMLAMRPSFTGPAGLSILSSFSLSMSSTSARSPRMTMSTVLPVMSISEICLPTMN